MIVLFGDRNAKPNKSSQHDHTKFHLFVGDRFKFNSESPLLNHITQQDKLKRIRESREKKVEKEKRIEKKNNNNNVKEKRSMNKKIKTRVRRRWNWDKLRRSKRRMNLIVLESRIEERKSKFKTKVRKTRRIAKTAFPFYFTKRDEPDERKWIEYGQQLALHSNKERTKRIKTNNRKSLKENLVNLSISWYCSCHVRIDKITYQCARNWPILSTLYWFS